MLGVRKIFVRQTDSELRKGLVLGLVLFVAWLAAIFLGSHKSWVNWVVDLLPLPLFAYCFYECFREIFSRMRKH